MSDLFSSQATEYRKQGLYGKVLLKPEISHTVIFVFLFCWFLGLFVWLISCEYSRKETVVGWLEPPEGIIRVYGDSTGVVQDILINEGESVQQDQPLIVVNDEQILASGENLNLHLLNELFSQEKLLQEQIARTKSNYLQKNQDLTDQIKSAQQDIDLIQDQLEMTNKRGGLIAEQVSRYTRLKHDGHVSNVELDNILAQELSLKKEQKDLLRNKNSQKNTLEKLKSELTLLPGQRDDVLGQLQNNISDLSRQIAQVQGSSSKIIKAPRAGVVNNLQPTEGQQLASDNKIPLLTILPFNSTLTIYLLIPVRSIGFVEEGQELSIRYDAFPYEKFGIYKGKIHSVSKTLLLPNELLNAPVSTIEPVYKVGAVLERLSVQAYGKDFLLKPGMTLSADIDLGERTLLQWLLEPIYSLKGRL